MKLLHQSHPGNISTETHNPEVSRTIVNCGAATENVGQMMKSIQDMFLRKESHS